ncbi:MAG TPA: 6-pyruvoyl tetrahydropterin synthase family protein [Ktedonobacterales bacterium]
MAWKILIERGNLGFSAAHFITFEGDCEPLHGHNYGVRVEAVGDLGPDSYVLDFRTLKRIVRGICKEWDHHFLLPLRNPNLRVAEVADAWEIEFQPTHPAATRTAPPHLRYVLPAWSVVPLDVDNATAERLSQALGERIADQLRAEGLLAGLSALQVGVQETEMQIAFYTLHLRDTAPPSHPPGV